MRAMMSDVRKGLREDLLELTNGAPAGKARTALLRSEGHPFGRGAVPQSGPAARKRGKIPSLPIGRISGRLRSAAYAYVQPGGTKITAGFSKRAGSSVYVVLPSGTKRMVARGFWGPHEGGAMGKRVKARRKAVADKLAEIGRSA